jgi:hypothetical protein
MMNLVGMSKCPAINTIVRHIQGSLGKPSYVAFFKATRTHSLKEPVPVQRLAGNLVVRPNIVEFEWASFF